MSTHAYTVPPHEQERLEEAAQRVRTRLDPRELIAELIVGGTLVLVAGTLWASGADDGPGWPIYLAFIGVLAAMARVRFAVGSGFTVPTQLVFVPMLFLLPPEHLPACVAAGFVLSSVPDVVRGHWSPARLALRIGDVWFSVGPALVVLLAGGAHDQERWWLLCPLAFLAQIAGDFLATAVREFINRGDGLPEILREVRWIYAIDAALTPPALLLAFGAAGQPARVLLALPLAVVLERFSRERQGRIEHVLELSRAYRGTAMVLGDVVEADDAYTADHSRGVVDLSLAVAVRMGLDETSCRRVEFAALLHDVGKIAIPNEIVNKPGPLDDDEWAIVRTHTIAGQRMLDRVGGLMGDVGRIVRSSHERWDGGGYPDGLAGEDILLEARIISCCDAFSAMTTTRPYRAARPASEALDECRAHAGTQFDPAVVDALVAVADAS
jgi:HD-GYP domain-containing protein (c-di-GMP phosphodiesterase class II)